MNKNESITRADLRCGVVMDITFNRNVLDQWWKERFNYIDNIEDVEIKFESKKHEDDFYSNFECNMISAIEYEDGLQNLMIEWENYCDEVMSEVYSQYKKGDMVYPKVVWIEILYNNYYITDYERENFSDLSPGHFAIDIAEKE
jgi:hypothetical protein